MKNRKSKYAISNKNYKEIKKLANKYCSVSMIDIGKPMFLFGILYLILFSIFVYLFYFTGLRVAWWLSGFFMIFTAILSIYFFSIFISCKRKGMFCSTIFFTDDYLVFDAGEPFMIPKKSIKTASVKTNENIFYSANLIKIQTDDVNEIIFKSSVNSNELIDLFDLNQVYIDEIRK